MTTKSLFISVFHSFFSPKQKQEDARRQEFILNLFLASSLLLSLASVLIILSNSFIQGSQYAETHLPSTLLAFAFFLILYLFSRHKYYKLAAVLLVGLYICLGMYCIYQWGLLLPWGELVCILAIIMAGTVLGTRASLITLGIIVINVAVYYTLETRTVVHPNLSWSNQLSVLSDLIILILFFSIIALISWLSNREIEKSLQRARYSEEALKKERDLLELKVEERTKDLQAAQLEKISQLYRFAEFGKLTSGILHDLVSPLNAVSLNLEKMSGKEHSQMLKRAIAGTKRMERFIEEARQQIRQQPTRELFSLSIEISTAITSLQPRANQKGVVLQFTKNSEATIYGNAIRFQQLITNLISNAIDAYHEKNIKNVILISLEQTGAFIYLRVQDFGSGILEKYKEKIFEPFFTTKSSEQGTGIGLSLCREIVEKDFSGKLTVISEHNKGTLFSVEIPYDQPIQSSAT